jgi:hypothetical protein
MAGGVRFKIKFPADGADERRLLPGFYKHICDNQRNLREKTINKYV